MADMKGTFIQGSWIRHVAISRDQVVIARAVAMHIPNSLSISFAVLLLGSFITFRIFIPVATIWRLQCVAPEHSGSEVLSPRPRCRNNLLVPKFVCPPNSLSSRDLETPPFYAADRRESGAIVLLIARISAKSHLEIVIEASEARKLLLVDCP